jgi:antitoxin ParD1/3/4
MAKIDLSVPDQMIAYLEAQVSSGRYADVGEYVRDLVRRDEQRRSALSQVQELVDEAIASGPTRPIDLDTFLRNQNLRADGQN